MASKSLREDFPSYFNTNVSEESTTLSFKPDASIGIDQGHSGAVEIQSLDYQELKPLVVFLYRQFKSNCVFN